MIRVVADTNVLISALMFGGLPGRFLDLALLRYFTLLTSNVLLNELDEKLRGKFDLSSSDADFVRRRLEDSALIIEPHISISVVIDDPDDNRVLECAIAGYAGYVVSGDRHLLKLGSHDGIAILSVRQFMDAAVAGL